MAREVDRNVEAVRRKLLARSKAGIAEHGATTERTDYDLFDWLEHLQEELMDAAVYTQAMMVRMEAMEDSLYQYQLAMDYLDELNVPRKRVDSEFDRTLIDRIVSLLKRQQYG